MVAKETKTKIIKLNIVFILYQELTDLESDLVVEDKFQAAI